MRVRQNDSVRRELSAADRAPVRGIGAEANFVYADPFICFIDGDEDEDDKKFTERFNKLFHKAMGERDKRLMGKIGDLIGEKLEEGLGEKLGSLIDEKLSQYTIENDGEEEAKGGDGQPAKLSAETEALIRQAQKDAAEAKAATEKAKAEAAAKQAKLDRAEERQKLSDALGSSVKKSLLPMVLNDLHANRLVRDKDNPETILWKNDEGELVPFTAGVEEWMKSDYAKEVAPPRDVRGTGNRGTGDGKGSGAKTFTSEDLGETVLASIPR